MTSGTIADAARRARRGTTVAVFGALGLLVVFAPPLSAATPGPASTTGAAAPPASAAPAASPGWTLETLLPLLAAREPVRLRFAERHFVAILDQPIDTTGELRFSPPDRLEKQSLGPRSERLVLDGRTLTIERDGLRRSVDLASVPEAAALAQGLRAVLNGDVAALKRDFSVRVDGTRARWTLELVPRQATTARLIEHIRIGGEHGEVSTIDVQQSSGDRSVMRVSRER